MVREVVGLPPIQATVSPTAADGRCPWETGMRVPGISLRPAAVGRRKKPVGFSRGPVITRIVHAIVMAGRSVPASVTAGQGAPAFVMTGQCVPAPVGRSAP
jgi:hypothetical protein